MNSRFRIALACASSVPTLAAAVLAASLLPTAAFGQTGGTLVAGTGNFNSGTNTVTQTSSRAVFEWSDISVAQGATLTFAQPNAQSITLNRVVGTAQGFAATNIDGTINANGQVWILNPAGVFVNSTGVVSAAGFLASTGSLSNLTDAGFVNDTLNAFVFTNPGSSAQVANAGKITTNNGYTVLTGAKVANSGGGSNGIQAFQGTIVLAAGGELALDLVGNQLITFQLTQPNGVNQGVASVFNSGTLSAAGGRIFMSANAAVAAIGSVVNHSGIAYAASTRVGNGLVVLDAGEGGTTTDTGSINVSGIVAGSPLGAAAGSQGGTAYVLGTNVDVGATAIVNAAGDLGGGTVLIGTYDQQTPSANSLSVTVAQGAKVDASALINGAGGLIAVGGDRSAPGSILTSAGDFKADSAGGGAGGVIRFASYTMDLQNTSGSVRGIGTGAAPGTLDLEAAGFAVVASGTLTTPQPGDPTQFDADTISNFLSNNTGVNINASVAPGPGVPGIGTVDITAPITKSGGPVTTLGIGAAGDIIFEPNSNLTATNSAFQLLMQAQGVGGIQLHSDLLLDTLIHSPVSISGRLQIFDNARTITATDFSINGSIDTGAGEASPANLTINAQSGLVNFLSPVGVVAPLGTLDINAQTLSATDINTVNNLQVAVNGSGSAINGALNINKLFKAGLGVLTLGAGANTITGGITIDQGPLEIFSSGALGTGTLTLSGGTLRHSGSGAVLLDSTINVTADSRIEFTASGVVAEMGADGLVDGAAGLTITSAGDLLISNQIGGITPLSSLSLDAASVLTLGGGAQINTTGDIKIAASNLFKNQSFANTPLISSAGHWTIWSGNADPFGGATPDELGALIYDYKAYDISSAQYRTGTPPLPNFSQPGNALYYSLAPQATGAITGTITKEYDGTTDLPVNLNLNGSVTGGVNGDSLQLVPPTAYGFNSPNTDATQVQFLGAAIAATDIFGKPVYGYKLANPIITSPASITPKLLGVNLTGLVRRNYDGGFGATLSSVNYAITGIVLGENITVNQTIGTFATKDVGQNLQISANLSPSHIGAGGGTLASNYALPATATGNIGQIDQAPVTVSLIGSVARDYDGTLNTPFLFSNNLSISGVVAGELLNYPTLFGTYASKNAGTGISVSATLPTSGIAGTGNTLLSNYLLPTTATGNIGTINQLLLGVNLTGLVQRNYDGTVNAVLTPANFNLIGVASGESLSINQTTGVFASKDVGQNLRIDATLSQVNLVAGANTLASNYLLPASATGNIGQIDQATLTATLIGSVVRNYDGTFGAALTQGNYSLVGLAAGDSISVGQSVGTFASKDVGQNIAITASLAPADLTAAQGTLLSNYVLPTTAAGNIGQINQAPVTATLIGGVNRFYDGTFAAPIGAGNISLSGFVAGEGVTYSQVAGTYASKDAGLNIGVTAQLGQALATPVGPTLLSNYLLPTTASGNIGSISQALLTVSVVGNVTKAYDGTSTAPLTAANFQIGGAAPGEVLTISPVTGNFFNFVFSPITGTNIPTQIKDVGSNLLISANVQQANLVAGQGALASNYTIFAVNNGSGGSITPAALTATLTGAISRTYDGSFNAAVLGNNITLSGLANGESIAYGPVTGLYASKDVGSGINITAQLGQATVTPTAVTLLSNYTLPTVAAGNIGAITPQAVTATLIGTTSKVYDGTSVATLTAANFSVSGAIAGETLSVTPVNGTYQKFVTVSGVNGQATLTIVPNVDVGSPLRVSATLAQSNLVAGQGTLASNYSLGGIAFNPIGTITPATATYVADPATRQAGTANPTFTGSVTGFVAGDTLANATTGTLLFQSPATTQSLEGNYAINGSGLTALNYQFVQAVGNATALTVTPAQNIQAQIVSVVNTVTQSPTTPGTQTIRFDLPPPPPPIIQQPPLTPALVETLGQGAGFVPNGPGSNSGSGFTPPINTAPPPASSTPGSGGGGGMMVVPAPPLGLASPPPLGPSPVGQQAPQTPVDGEDSTDPVLQSQTQGEQQGQPQDGPNGPQQPNDNHNGQTRLNAQIIQSPTNVTPAQTPNPLDVNNFSMGLDIS